MANTSPWRFWIDTGGTFTDCLAQTPEGQFVRQKVLSTGAVRGKVVEIVDDTRLVVQGLPVGPADFYAGYTLYVLGGDVCAYVVASGVMQDAVILTCQTRVVLGRGTVIDLAAGEEAPVLAMRVVTGVPLGRRLPAPELRLATTRGTNALLEGKGARVAFFVTEGFGDLLRIGDQRRPDLFALRVVKPAPLHGPVVEVAERLAADGTVVRALDLDAARAAARGLLAAGIDVAAVALMHSYVNPAHERAVAQALRELGFAHVSVSSELSPFIKLVPRAETAVVDAVLAPVMERYLSGVSAAMNGGRFLVMTSAGGLVGRDAYRPKDSLLSGPAGGVAGAAAVARSTGFTRVLTFDMGGTSTDVARWAGDFDYRYQHAVGPARVFAPAVRVESVAAGGGSICRFDGAALVVGPESAGASPGPACYGGGGPLTLTDVNLLLGRLDVATFGLPVEVAAAEARLHELRDDMRRSTGSAPERSAVLEGFLAIANERMAEAIRRISVHEGYDPTEHAMVAFGGAGGLHACATADRLGIQHIVFPAHSGLLSAAGLRAAMPERFAQRQILLPYARARESLADLLAQLAIEARDQLRRDGEAGEGANTRRAELELRFSGQETTLVVPALPLEEVESRFRAAHEARYGYVPTERTLEVVMVRVVVSAREPDATPESFDVVGPPVAAAGSRFARAALPAGGVIVGPAVVADAFSTLWIAPGWRGIVGAAGSILLEHFGAASDAVGTNAREVDLELFTCRFLALVGDMGELLRRCALSVNVKERLDFSCALLDADGLLVANAPHIPVHLGALGLCVRCLRAVIAMGPGDVVVTNHPAYGGSHLPDITLVAPVHDDAGGLLGFVATRAHHAEIGGVQPGSMSPQARRLVEEGVVIAPRYLVRDGEAQWDAMREVLGSAPFPSRAVEENLADLHAQLAAIRHGVAALRTLARQQGSMRVREFMVRLQARAAEAVAASLARLSSGPWAARDSLDDGTLVQVRCARSSGAPARLSIDFLGSGAVHLGNLNATPAIVRSAVLYVLRVLAGQELPLNEGLMRDVDLVVPVGVLAPEFDADPAKCPAVAGGNVETSQRVVDVLLRAFGLVACSQGTMNNLVFGTERRSYYETIGGGTGAGPGFAGAAAVHSHMTNTAITDPEVMERSWPLRVERFGIRRDSGGQGTFPGGDGIDRRLRFLAPVALSLLTQRRRAGPPGLDRGAPGEPGRQWIDRAEGRREPLAEIAQVEIHVGDCLVMLTPGGGGWGQ